MKKNEGHEGLRGWEPFVVLGWLGREVRETAEHGSHGGHGGHGNGNINCFLLWAWRESLCDVSKCNGNFS